MFAITYYCYYFYRTHCVYCANDANCNFQSNTWLTYNCKKNVLNTTEFTTDAVSTMHVICQAVIFNICS